MTKVGAPFDISYVFEYLVKLLPTLKITLLIVVSSIVIGLGVGFIVALPQLYKVPVLKRFSQVYLSFFRGTPILIQLFLFYYGIPEVLKLVRVDVARVPALYFVILTYALHSGAYMAEMIRAASARGSRTGRGCLCRRHDRISSLHENRAAASDGHFGPGIRQSGDRQFEGYFTRLFVGHYGAYRQVADAGSHVQTFYRNYISLAIIYFIISFDLRSCFILLNASC